MKWITIPEGVEFPKQVQAPVQHQLPSQHFASGSQETATPHPIQFVPQDFEISRTVTPHAPDIQDQAHGNGCSSNSDLQQVNNTFSNQGSGNLTNNQIGAMEVYNGDVYNSGLHTHNYMCLHGIPPSPMLSQANRNEQFMATPQPMSNVVYGVPAMANPRFAQSQHQAFQNSKNAPPQVPHAQYQIYDNSAMAAHPQLPQYWDQPSPNLTMLDVHNDRVQHQYPERRSPQINQIQYQAHQSLAMAPCLQAPQYHPELSQNTETMAAQPEHRPMSAADMSHLHQQYKDDMMSKEIAEYDAEYLSDDE